MAELKQEQALPLPLDVLQDSRELPTSPNLSPDNTVARSNGEPRLVVPLAEEGVSDEDQYSEMSTDSDSFHYDPFMMLPQHHKSHQPFTQFNITEAEKIINKVLKDALTGVSYNFETFSELTVQLSTQIKDQIKEEMYLPRYKLVSSVTIGQLNSPEEQGAVIGTCSKPLWNENTDSFAQASFVSAHLYATGVVYAAYYY